MFLLSRPLLRDSLASFVLLSLVAGISPLHGKEAAGWRPPSGGADRYTGTDSARRGAHEAPALRETGSYKSKGPMGANPTHSNIGPIGGSRLAPIGGGPTRARVTKGSGSLPRDQGQVWRNYDIRPYTLRIEGSERPEQAIVDWILRETGYEAWHSDPVSLLSANRETLRVYHTPEMQAVVANIVDRYVNPQADAVAFSMRVFTLTNPNWRAKAMPYMTPISIQTPGVQGWLLAKEDVRMLEAKIRSRTDFREYTSSQQLINNGKTIVLSTMRPRTYIKGAVSTQTAWPGYQPEMGQLEEGFSLEFSPLLSLDLASADAIVKLRLSQIEKMVPVKLDLPTAVAPNQRVQIEVPQITMANIHERFHWPSDKVLLLSMGVIATPGATKGNPLTKAVPFLRSPPRADALMVIECKGRVLPSAITGPAASTATLPQQSFHGRY